MRTQAAEALKTGRWAEARSAYEAALQSGDASPEVLWPLARLWAIEDPARAHTYLQTLLRHPQLPPAYRARARLLEQALARGLSVEHPAYRLVEAGRGLARIGDWPLAREAWRRATRLDPTYAMAWAYLGEAEARLGHPEKAWTAWHRARLLAPWDPLPPFLMGLQALREDRIYLASGWLSRAVVLAPREPLYRYHLARALARREGFFPQAWSQVEILAREGETNPTAWQLAARFAIEHRVHLESHALPWLRRAYLRRPEDPQTLLLFGWAYLELGQPDLALRFLQRAQALAPDDPQVLRLLALWYQAQGQPEQAEAYRRRARQKEGDANPAFQGP